MRFKKVTIQNFLSYGPAQEISLDKQGLVGVFGANTDSAFDSNGAGKSAIIEAIVWCLWGATVRGLKADEVINTTAGKNCEVTLEVDDGPQQYTITRYREKDDVKKKNDVLIFVNETDATHGTVTDTQAMIDAIVGINFDTFSQSVLLTANTQSFCTLRDSEQKEVLEDILNIDILRRAQAEAKKRITALQTDLAGHLGALEPISEYVDSVEADIVALENKSETFERERDLRKKRGQQSIIEAEKQVADAKAAVALGRELDANMKAMESEEIAVREDMIGLEQSIRDVDTKVAANTHKLTLKKVEHDTIVSITRNSISRLASLAGTVCVTCSQEIDIDNAEAQIERLEAEADAASNVVLNLVMLEGRLVTAGDSEKAPFIDRLGPLRDELKTLHDEMTGTGQAIRDASKGSASLDAFEVRLKDLKDRAAEDLLEENPFKELIAAGHSDIKQRKKDAKSLKTKIKGVELELKGLRFWERGFGNKGLKSYIMDNVVPFLNEKAQKYADIMSDGALTIKFATQTKLKGGELREKFNVSVVNANGADVYKGNSSGERRRSDVAIGWALADLAATRASKPIRFRGLDEPFENLDAEGIDAVFRLLQHAAKEYESIFCITHNSELKNRFNKELVVEKRSGYSTIRQ